MREMTSTGIWTGIDITTVHQPGPVIINTAINTNHQNSLVVSPKIVRHLTYVHTLCIYTILSREISRQDFD